MPFSAIFALFLDLMVSDLSGLTNDEKICFMIDVVPLFFLVFANFYQFL